MANLTTGNWTATAGTNTCNGLALTTNTTDYTIPNGVTVTLVAANTVVARSLTIAAGGTLIFAATTSVINMGDTASGTGGAGNVALNVDAGATVTLTGIGTINFVTTTGTQQTITTGGKTMPNITINGVVGSSYALGDALTSSGTFQISAGTFSTSGSNFAITCVGFSVSASTARTVTLGSSSITCSGTTVATWNGQNCTNLTFTANTAVATLTGSGGSFTSWNSGSFNWNGLGVVFSGVGTQGITSAAAFMVTLANVTRTGTAVKTDSFALVGSLTCTSAFTVNSNSSVNRVLVQSATVGTTVSITAGTVSINNTDFMDISLVTAFPVVVSDSFNRSNGSLGTSDSAGGGTAATWGTATGTWAIASNAVVPPASGGSIGLPVGISNMRVSAKLTANSPNSGDSTIICARYTDWNNALQLFCYPTGQLTLYSRVAGTYTNVATMTGTFVAGDTVSLQVIGLAYTVLKNGAIVGTGSVPSTVLNTVTAAGIGFNGSGGASVIIDDFKVQQTVASGTSLGDCQGNSGITFTTPVTRFAVVAGNWSSTAMWSSSSGGAGGATVPLPQDNVFLNASSAAGTYTVDMPRVGKDLDCTGFTRTLATSVTYSVYGSLTFVSGMTFTSANGATFAGRGNHTVTMAGKAIGTGATFAGFGGTYTQQDDFTWNAASNTTHTAGAWVSNNFAMTGGGFITNGSIARALTLGTSTMSLVLTSGNVWAAAAGLTLSAASSTFVLSTISGSSRTFAGAGFTYGTLTYTIANSPGNLVITGANYFDTLNVGSGRTLNFTSAIINTVKNWNVLGQTNGYQYFAGLQTGVGGVAVSTPDAAPIRFTSSFTMDVKFLPNVTGNNTWAGNGTAALAYKTNSAITQGYGLRMTNAGALTLHAAGVGSTSPTTMGSVFADGTPGWVRVVWNDATNLSTWFTSPDGATWTSMGAAQAHSAAGITDSGLPMYIGSRNTGNDSFTGRIYRVRTYSDATQSTLAFDADFSAKTFGANTFTESSSNGATVTIEGDIDKVGDGRLSLTSTTPGTAAYLALFGAPATMDFLTVQDVFSSVPYKFYAGANSVSVSGNTNVILTANVTQPYMAFYADTPVTTSATSVTTAFMGSYTPTAGNLLLLALSSQTNPGTVTTPSGWTLVDTSSSLSSATRVFSKIADGTENSVTVVWTLTNTVQAWLVEIAGWAGVPTLDVKDKNNSAAVSVTTLSTGSGVTNTAAPAYAFAIFNGASSLGATVSVSNSFQQGRGQSSDLTSYMKMAAKPLLATGSQTTTYVWTTARVAASQLVVFVDVGGGAAYRLLLGVGS